MSFEMKKFQSDLLESVKQVRRGEAARVTKVKDSKRAQMAAGLAAAAPDGPPTGIDWSKAVRTSGGGVAATIAELRRVRGKNKAPPKSRSQFASIQKF